MNTTDREYVEKNLDVLRVHCLERDIEYTHEIELIFIKGVTTGMKVALEELKGI